MFSKLRSHVRHNVVAYIALFIALGGTSAYATHETILSSDIVDGEVKTPDLGASAVTNAKLGTSAVSNVKLATGAVTNAKLGASAVSSGKVLDSSLQGADLLNGTVATADLANAAVTPGKTATVPAVRARKSSDQSFIGSAALALEVEDFDTAGLHDPSVNNTRLTASISGIYQVSAGVAWTSNTSGVRDLALRVNGICCVAENTETPVSGAITRQTVSDAVKLSAGDFVEAQIFHGNEFPLSALAGPQSFLAMTWIGPG